MTTLRADVAIRVGTTRSEGEPSILVPSFLGGVAVLPPDTVLYLVVAEFPSFLEAERASVLVDLALHYVISRKLTIVSVVVSAYLVARAVFCRFRCCDTTLAVFLILIFSTASGCRQEHFPLSISCRSIR